MPDQGKSQTARVVAVGGLIMVFVLVIAVIATTRGGSSSKTTKQATVTAGAQSRDPRVRRAVRTGYYVVQPGDTIDSIALATGVDAATLQQLNPRVDPQRLATGAKLKLRAQ